MSARWPPRGRPEAWSEVMLPPRSRSYERGWPSRGHSMRWLKKSTCRALSLSGRLTRPTGMSPMAYLRQMRVERMAHLLVSTDLSIAEAAHSVGWRNQFHASQCFHAHYGISPTEYRRRQTTPPLG
jgi:methylphosphotriester-DNA--protein-cysteine methyltransferase